jgi:hypothetical protein
VKSAEEICGGDEAARLTKDKTGSVTGRCGLLLLAKGGNEMIVYLACTHRCEQTVRRDVSVSSKVLFFI